jgi:hypothetical protein
MSRLFELRTVKSIICTMYDSGSGTTSVPVARYNRKMLPDWNAGSAHALRSSVALRGATPFPDAAGGAFRLVGSRPGGLRHLWRALLCGDAAHRRDGDPHGAGRAAARRARNGAAPALGRYLESLLFRVSPRDPLAFAVSGAVLLVVSVAACLVPARGATRVSPIEALRFE